MLYTKHLRIFNQLAVCPITSEAICLYSLSVSILNVLFLEKQDVMGRCANSLLMHVLSSWLLKWYSSCLFLSISTKSHYTIIINTDNWPAEGSGVLHVCLSNKQPKFWFCSCFPTNHDKLWMTKVKAKGSVHFPYIIHIK